MREPPGSCIFMGYDGMKMLKHEPSGRIYVFNAQLARAAGMEEFDDPDFGKLEGAESGGPENEDAPKSLDEMTRDELLVIATMESDQRGDKIALARMKKAELIAYITGQSGEGA